MRQVIRVNPDAVATYQPWFELEEIPLGACGFQHFIGIDAQLVKDDGQLVHQRDIEITLRVLDDFGRLGSLDAGCTMHTRHDDALVQPGHPVKCFRGIA